LREVAMNKNQRQNLATQKGNKNLAGFEHEGN
jgi:hypothetical protein